MSTSSSSSSLSSLSSLSSSGVYSAIGCTYYSDFRNINAINNPLINNSVQMQYGGYWEKDWLPTDLTFDSFGYGLKRTLNSQGSIFCNDASKLFSMGRGYMGMVISLPYPIINGIYEPLINDVTDINELFLCGINIGRYQVSQPSLYAALTPRGIEFTIWTSAGLNVITDTSTNIDANTNTFLEFVWDKDVLTNYLIRTAIRVDNVFTAAGNPPINDDDISNVGFYVLNTPFSYNNYECTIRKLVVYNTIPDDFVVIFNTSSSSSSSLSSSSSSSSNWLAISSSSSGSSSSSNMGKWHARDSIRAWSSLAVTGNGQLQYATVSQDHIYKSTDYGITWLPINTSPIAIWSHISTSGNGVHISAVGDGYIWVSANSGLSWTEKSGSPDVQQFTSVSMDSSGQYQTATVFGGGIWISSNYGVTWGLSSASPLLWVTSANTGQYQKAVVQFGYIYGSADFGNSWNPVGTSSPGVKDWSAVAMASATSATWAAAEGTGGPGYIWVSTQSGGIQQKTPHDNFTAIAMSGYGSIITATANSGIYMSNDTGNTWVVAVPNRAGWDIAMSFDGRYQTAIVLTDVGGQRQIYTYQAY